MTERIQFEPRLVLFGIALALLAFVVPPLFRTASIAACEAGPNVQLVPS